MTTTHTDCGGCVHPPHVTLLCGQRRPDGLTCTCVVGPPPDQPGATMISESDIPIHGWSPYDDIHRERIRAHDKHGAANHSCEQISADDPEWLAILGEEFGEVCHEMTYDSGSTDHYMRLRKELIQVAAMAAAWIDAIDRHD